MNSTTPFVDFLTREAAPATPDFFLLGNALKRWVLDDTEVQAASVKMMCLGHQYFRYRTICDNMEFAGVYNRHLWPLDLRASVLACRMVPIDIADEGNIPSAINLAAELIVKRYGEAVKSLRQGMPLLFDMNNAHIKPTVLCGPQLATDVRTSDLWEIPSIENWPSSENGNRRLKDRLYIDLPNPDKQKPIIASSLKLALTDANEESGASAVRQRGRPQVDKPVVFQNLSKACRESLEQAFHELFENQIP